MQYDSLGIPHGAQIVNANITFTIDSTGWSDDPNNQGNPDVTIYAESAANSTTFTGDDFNLTSRPRSAASVGWSVPPVPDTPEGDALVGTTVVTPDLTALVQETVNHPDWVENNMISFLVFPDAYLGLSDPATGGATIVQEVEMEAGPPLHLDSVLLGGENDSAVLSVTFIHPSSEGGVIENKITPNLWPPFIAEGNYLVLTAPLSQNSHYE